VPGGTLLPALQPRRFVAVDIAAAAIGPALARAPAPAFPAIELVGVVTDFRSGSTRRARSMTAR
jgi:uncharacterized SAM-dependent methyltransferase